MDPLSIAASIAGLVTLADLVFRRSVSYVKAVKSSAGDLSRLATELRLLCGTLNDLSLLVTELEDEGDGDSIAIHSDHIGQCEKTLKEIKAKFPQLEPSKLRTSERLTKKFFSPFSASEIEALITKLERSKSSFGLALGANSVRKMIELLDGQEVVLNQVRGVKEELLFRHKLADQVALDERKTRVIQFFRPVDPQQNHDMSMKLKFPGTGQWFEDLQAYKNWSNGLASGLWVYGIPGAGKTILASSIIQLAISECEDDSAVAYFYCDYRDVKKQDPLNILGAIAVQLALRSDSAFDLLQKLYSKVHSTNRTSRGFDADDLCQLIGKMTNLFATTTIVIDGVDECLENSTYITRSFVTLAQTCAEHAKVAILSRDEYDIRTVIKQANFTGISIEAHKEDLMLYVAASIKDRMRDGRLRVKSKELEGLILERLVDGAQGMFRWVVCQLDHLCDLPTDAKRRAALSTLPPTHDATYERILFRVAGQPEATQAIVRRSLCWVLYGGSLTTEQLCEAVSLDDDMEDLDPEDRCDVEDIMRFCRSLFRYSAKGNLESAHFTVVEFFAGQRLERHNTLKHFWTPRHVALRYIANTCLRYLILDAFREAAPESERERHEFEVQYPFYKIASHRWCPNQVADPAFLEVDQTTTELLQTLFHPKKTPNFTRWAFEYMQATHYRVPEMETHHSISPLHLAVVIGLSLTVKWIMSLDPAAVDLVSSYYGSALHWAILGHVSVVMALMRAISFEEACDLTYRSLHTPEEIVMLLLRSSPDLSARFPMAHSIPGPSAAEMLLYKRLTFGIPILHARQHQFSASSLKYLEVMISHGRGHDHGSICQFMDATLFQPDAHADAALLRLALSQPESGYSDKFAGVDVNKMLSKAIVGDRVDVVDEIIRARPDAIRHHCAPGRGTALHTAAVNGSARCMERILSFGISAQLVDEKQSTALHICARRETLCAEILLKHGCDPLSEDDMGQTVYHVAAASNNHHLLSILLDKSDHSTNSTVFLIEDAARRTPLLAAVEQGADDAVATLLPFAPQVVSQHLATQLVASAARYCSPSNLEAVLELYDHSCPNEPLPPYLIHGLCSSPRCTVQGIKKIMSKSDATLQFDDEGESPLHAYLSVPPEASSIGRTSAETQVIAKLLACEEIINGLDRRGQSVVDLLLARNDLDHPARTVIIADFLLAGLNPHLALSAICANSEACKWLGELEDLLNPVFDRIDQLEMSKHAVFATFALLRSPHTHHLLLRLLDKGLDVDWICDNGYSLCEQAAIVVPSFVVFSNFLQKSRRTTAPNKDGNLMTHVLCSQKSAIGATTHLRALLDAGIDPNAVSTHGSTALIEAISHDNDEFVHLLLERGAKLDLRGQTTKEGWHNERMYPLHWATALGSVQSMRMLLVHCADFGGVLDFSDADMFEIDGVRFGGLKVLHLAVFYGQRLIIQLLLERPYVDVNDLAEGKHTALHLAAVDRNPDIVWYLLVKGASTALQDRSGNTALHLAAMAGDWNIGQRLVDAGSPQTLDHNGLNPLSLAIASKHESFAEALSAWNLKTNTTPETSADVSEHKASLRRCASW